jgi:hypothetical protein
VTALTALIPLLSFQASGARAAATAKMFSFLSGSTPPLEIDFAALRKLRDDDTKCAIA